MTLVLCVPTAPKDAGEPAAHGSLAGNECFNEICNAGRAFARRRVRGRSSSVGSNADKPAAPVSDEFGDVIPGGNYYEVLGLKEIGFDATEDQVKRAYHKALLQHHPDKTGRGETDPLFLAIQTAHNTLMSVQKRRAYDSQCDFDDAIPTGNEKGDFYAVYGPVFLRNARFAEVKPVPLLGDDDTPFEEVEAFYDYWYKFDSWRDFTHDAEHDVDSAEHREEKRHMMKENETANKKKKKKEYARLANLVDRAIARDPRIAKEKRRKKEEKEAIKRRKEEEATRAQREAEAAAAAAAAEAEAEEAKRKEASKAAKFSREAEKKLLRKARNGMRKLAVIAGGDAVLAAEDDINMLCETLSLQRLSALGQQMKEALGEEEPYTDAQKTAAWEFVLVAVRRATAQLSAEEEQEELRKEEAAAAAMAAAAEKAKQARMQDRPWTDDEMSMLAKAANKFPAGCANRWVTVSNWLSTQLALQNPRTDKECIAQYQLINHRPASSKSLMSVAEKVAADSAAAAHAAAAAAPSNSEDTAAAPAPASNGGGQVGGGGKKGKKGKKAAEAEAKAAAAAAASKAASTPAAWSEEQQNQLEAALAEFPTTMEKNARWSAIAAAVEGKGKKACVARYKELRDKLLEQKK